MAAGLLLALAASGIAATAGAQAVRALAWDDLRPVLDPVEDPFAALSDEQHDALAALVRGRVLEARGFPVGDEGHRRRAEIERRLRSQGLDVEALLARREAIIAQRSAAAQTAVPALDGASVRLSGYLLPVTAGALGVTEFLLVPWAGACSHTPPPPANQVIRVRPQRPYPARQDYEAVEVGGTMRVAVGDLDVHALDGVVRVRSTYAVDAASVRKIDDAGAAR